MKQLFDETSNETAVHITKKYSTSFSRSVGYLDKSIRQDIYNIYGFVRVADEIVDSFEGYQQEKHLDLFEADVWFAIEDGVSANPVNNAFQHTVNKYHIPMPLIVAFLHSMRTDLTKKVYENQKEIDDYIYGSADVVGLMCLKVFVKGNEEEYERLKPSALKLGSAFQKVNFLRDLKQDFEDLNRAYFPNVDPNNFSESVKKDIVAEIKKDFRIAEEGMKQLPKEAKFAVCLAFTFYSQLLKKIEHTPAEVLKEKRIRLSNLKKTMLLTKSHIKHKLKLA